MAAVVEPEITEYSKDQINLSQGSTVDLYCVARGYPQPPTVVWHPPSFRDSNSNSRVESGGAHLTRSDLSVNQIGTYKCMISGTNKEKNISVIAQLTITLDAANRNLSANGTAKLGCEARAFPSRPSITWMWNGNVSQATLTTYTSVLSDGSLSLRSEITVRDPGEYVCHAEAGLGDQPQRQTVTVGLGNCLQLSELLRFFNGLVMKVLLVNFQSQQRTLQPNQLQVVIYTCLYSLLGL